MNHLTAGEARRFAEQWLPAWSANNPVLLAEIAKLKTPPART